jgi:hypothetical protein
LSFLVRKLYADVVAPDGSACIVYVIHVDALGFRARRAGAEIYGPAGERDVVRLSLPGGAADLPGSEPLDAPLEIHLEEGGAPFVLRYLDRGGSWAPAGPLGDVEWSVVEARAPAELAWRGGAMRGTGYADRVEIRRPPCAIGLRRLEWGRAHAGRESVVYSAMDLRSGASWKRAAHWTAGSPGPTEHERFDLEASPGRGRIALSPGSAGEMRFALGPPCVLHSGLAMDGRRFPDLVERGIVRLLSGRIVESRARRAARGSGGEGWMLGETVWFGRRGAREG